MIETDYIVVGQGIAGTALSFELLRRGRRVLVFDVPNPKSASRVAAGIFNPVTGRGAVKTWKAETIFPFLKAFYTDFEHFLNIHFLHAKDGARFFRSMEERNRIHAKSADPGMELFLNTETDASLYRDAFKPDLGFFEIKGSGYVDLITLLNKYRNYLLNNFLLKEEYLDTALLQLKTDTVVYKNVRARTIIFCEGTDMTKNPLFCALPLTPLKGELLDIRANDIPEHHIFHAGVFILPRGNGLYTVGATYDHSRLDCEPTEAGKKFLCEQLDAVLKVPYEVAAHRAGIRPAVHDRRPLVGPHPDVLNAYIFNGLGTKGVSLAPLLAVQLADHLEKKTDLLPEVKTDRFFLGKLPRKFDQHLRPEHL